MSFQKSEWLEQVLSLATCPRLEHNCFIINGLSLVKNLKKSSECYWWWFFIRVSGERIGLGNSEYPASCSNPCFRVFSASQTNAPQTWNPQFQKTKSIIQGKLNSNSSQKTQQHYTTCQQLENIPSAQHYVTLLTVESEGIWLVQHGTLWGLNGRFCFLCLNCCWLIGGQQHFGNAAHLWMDVSSVIWPVAQTGVICDTEGDLRFKYWITESGLSKTSSPR